MVQATIGIYIVRYLYWYLYIYFFLIQNQFVVSLTFLINKFSNYPIVFGMELIDLESLIPT